MITWIVRPSLAWWHEKANCVILCENRTFTRNTSNGPCFSVVINFYKWKTRSGLWIFFWLGAYFQDWNRKVGCQFRNSASSWIVEFQQRLFFWKEQPKIWHRIQFQDGRTKWVEQFKGSLSKSSNLKGVFQNFTNVRPHDQGRPNPFSPIP